MYYAFYSDARKSNSVLYVQNWFRRLEDFMSQAPLLQEALDELNEYKHPWCDKPDFHNWAKAKYGTEWKFDPLTHHTSVLLAEVKTHDVILGQTLQEFWAGSVSLNTRYASYRNRAREMARICGESLDHKPGSVDMQLIERADKQDGFQILHLMKKATIMHAKQSTTSDFVDQDAELNKIRHKFEVSGVHTYITAYKRQLRLFVEMKLPFQLPEQYNCQRMVTHLATRCQEFKKCAQRFAELVSEGKLKYRYHAVETAFERCERRNSLGPDNRGTPIPGISNTSPKLALLARQPPQQPPAKKTAFPKGSCPVHPNSTTHDASMCHVIKMRREFVHPVTGIKGLTNAMI